MKREVDVDTALQVVQNDLEVGISVAIARHESLWEVKRAAEDKLYFLNVIGVIDRKELVEWEDKVDGYYRKKKTELKKIEEDQFFDVGF